MPPSAAASASGRYWRWRPLACSRSTSAAPHVIVVHAGQIVVDQRIDVDRLDGGADADGAALVDREKASGRHRQQRPEALAAADRGVAHGLEQAVAAVSRRAQQMGKDGVDRPRYAPRLQVDVD